MRYWFPKCSEISQERLMQMRMREIRPTIKVILYDHNGFVWLCENTKKRLTLPGGGVDVDELPALGLLRELHEEVHGHVLSQRCIEDMPVLHYGQVPTHRDGFLNKGLFLTAGVCDSLSDLRPRKSDVLRRPQVIHISKVVEIIWNHQKTPSKLKELYVEGFMQLRSLLT